MKVNPRKNDLNRELSASALEWTPSKSTITVTAISTQLNPSPLTPENVPEFKPSAAECNDSEGNVSQLKKVAQGILRPNFQSPVGYDFSQTDSSKKIDPESPLKEIEENFSIFYRDVHYTSFAKIATFIKYLLNFPKSTIHDIPKNLLERLAILTVNSLALFDNYEFSRLACLFSDLGYKTDFLVKALVAEATNRIPHCNPTQLLRILKSFDQLSGYQKDSPLFSIIIEAILLKLNRFTADEIVDIAYFFGQKDESQTHLFEQLLKATIDLANIDLLNTKSPSTYSDSSEKIPNEQDPIYFQMSKKSILNNLHFSNFFFHVPMKDQRFTPDRSDTSTWEFLNLETKKNLFLNTMANRIIHQIDDFTTEDFERVNLDPTAVTLLHKSSCHARQSM